MKQSLRFLFRQAPALGALLALLGSGQALAQAPNDDCANAVALTAASVCSMPVNGTVAGATPSLAPTAGCGAGLSAATDVWYRFVATAPTHLLTLAPRFAAILDVRAGTCAASTSVFCTGIASNNTAAVQVGGLSSGQTYFVRVYPNSNTPPAGIASTFALCIGQGAAGPANDDCAGALAVPVNATGACTSTVSADNTLATASAGAPAPFCAGYRGRDLWFSVTVPAGGALTVQTVTPAAGPGVGDTGMSIYAGTCGSLAEIGCDDDAAGNLKSLLSFAGRTPGEVLYVRVWAFGDSESGPIAVCATTPAPLANDECPGATVLPVTAACAAPTSGTLAGATQSLPPTAACGSLGLATANDVWYRFVATGATQTLTLNSGFFVAVDVRSGSCGNSASVFCGTVAAGQGLTLSGLTGGQNYFLRVYLNTNFAPANLQFTICLTPGPTPAANDDCANAVLLPVGTSCTSPVGSTISGASQSLPPASCGSGGVSVANDVWYRFTASGATQTLAFNGGFQLVADVRSGTCAGSISVFCGVAFPNQPITVSGLTSGQAYFLRIYANNNIQPVVTTFTLCLTAGPAPAANDECAAAVAVAVVQGCATSTNGTVFAASQSLPPTAGCGAGTGAANDVWYSFVASSSTQLIALNARFAAVLDVRSGTCAASTSGFCTSVFANSTAGTVVGGLSAGQTYFIRIYAIGAALLPPAGATFTLCISPAPTPPVNDECAGALPVPVAAACAAPVAGTVAGASQSLPPTAGCGFGPGPAADVWYRFVATAASHNLAVTTAQGGFVVDVRSGTCAASASIFCNAVPSGAGPALAVGGLTPGQTYFIRMYSPAGAPLTGPAAGFTLCLTTLPPPPANDDCAGALPVPVQFGSACVGQTTADNTTATGSTGAPTPTCAAYQGRDVWFQATVPASGILTVRTVVPTAGLDVGDTGMSIYAGTCGSLAEIGCDDDAAGNLKSLLSFAGRTPGEVLYIRVWAYGNSAPGVLAVCATSPSNCAAPTAPAAAGITSTTAQLSWLPGGPPAAGTTYTVEYGPQGFAPGAGTVLAGQAAPAAALTGLQPGTAYCFFVRQNCLGTNGSSAYVGPTCFATPCAVPTALAATAITVTAALLGWQVGGTPAGATYSLEYGPPGFVPGTGTGVSGIPGTSFALSGLQAGTAYCFYVRQDCPGATGAAFAGPFCFSTAPASATCPSPGSLAAGSFAATGALLSWAPGGPPTPGLSYTVQYGLPGFALGTGVTVSGIASGSFALTGLAAATGYCFYVRQDCGGANGSSAYAGPVCFQTSTAAGGPANDEPCGAVPLTIGTAGAPAPTVAGTNVGATTSTQPGLQLPACAPTTTPRDVWFTMVPPAGTTSVALRLTGPAAGMVRVFTAPSCSAGPFTLATCQSSGASNTGVSSLVVSTVPGQPYYIAVSGYGPADAPGAFTLAGALVTASRVRAETNALLVFPNPSATGRLTLRLGAAAAGPATVGLLNALGQRVRTETLGRGATELVFGTQGLAAGLYTVQVVVGGQVLMRKVVLE